MEKLPIELRLQAFALYWGCEYTYKNEWGTYSGEVGDYHWMDHVKQGAKLNLKPLSKITGVDAAECVRLANDAFGRSLDELLSTGEFYDFLKEPDYVYCLPLAMIDYLRSKHYALPYMGYDTTL
jgi:hypothetical protein